MYLSYYCRTRSTLCKNVTQITRCLSGNGSTSSSGQRPRRAPRAMDLDGISLDTVVNTGTESKGYILDMKDLGQDDGHMNQLLSVRLQRRLSPSRDPKSLTPARRNPKDRREIRPQPRTADGAAPRFPRPRTDLTTRNAGGNAKPGSAPRSPRRAPRAQGGTFASRREDAEPEVPVTPAQIPSRVFIQTNLNNLTAPIQPPVRSTQSTNLVQRVRETVGGDYTKWVTKEDIAAAGDPRASPIARARLALAFNPTVSPGGKKQLLATSEMLLNGDKPRAAASS